ncbi:spore germination protein [Bacillus timonensis]|nr:spore germination protein [Bacillus timonensis]
MWKKLMNQKNDKSEYQPDDNDKPSLSYNKNENIQFLESYFTETPDLVYRHFQNPSGTSFTLVYLSDLADKSSINRDVIEPLVHKYNNQLPLDSIITVGEIKELFDWNSIIEALFEGFSILITDNKNSALRLETQGWPQRAIEEPQTESTLKGAHQGFIETAGKNIALIRRYLPHQELKMQKLKVGSRGKGTIHLLYLDDVVNKEALAMFKERLESIDVDSVINTGELVEFIESRPYSPFPQFLISERPDGVVSHLLQGRMAVILEGSPGALIAPMTFASFFQNVDDYSTRWITVSFIRLLRFLAFILAIFLPSFYIAAISFHYEVIPIELVLSVGESRQKVPYPPILEAFLMELVLEMLREAGQRLPAPIGQTVGIVGGIVIGQAAVEVGIVSNIMVIVVALTAISSFIFPNQDMAASVRLIRFPMMLISSMFGIVGIIIGMMCLFGHLASLKSLGIPYTSPMAPIIVKDWKDFLVRLPIFFMKHRPNSTKPQQDLRQGKKREWDDEN